MFLSASLNSELYGNSDQHLKCWYVLFFMSGGRWWIIYQRITASEVDCLAPAEIPSTDCVIVTAVREGRTQICRSTSCTGIICRSAGRSHTMGN